MTETIAELPTDVSIAWSSFAPELAMTVAVVALLLVVPLRSLSPV